MEHVVTMLLINYDVGGSYTFFRYISVTSPHRAIPLSRNTSATSLTSVPYLSCPNDDTPYDSRTEPNVCHDRILV